MTKLKDGWHYLPKADGKLWRGNRHYWLVYIKDNVPIGLNGYWTRVSAMAMIEQQTDIIQQSYKHHLQDVQEVWKEPLSFFMPDLPSPAELPSADAIYELDL